MKPLPRHANAVRSVCMSAVENQLCQWANNHLAVVDCLLLRDILRGNAIKL